MAPSLDFNATLAEQLRDAGMQMRAMTKPQKQRATPDVTPDATAGAAPETANVTDAPTAGATPETTTATTVGATAGGAAAADNTPSARKNAHSTGQDKTGHDRPDLGKTLGKALAEASAEVHASEAAEATVTTNNPRDSHGAAISSHEQSSLHSAGDGAANSHSAESAHSFDHSLRDTLPNSNDSRHSAQDSHAAIGATTDGAIGTATGGAIGATIGATGGVSTAQDVAVTVHEAAAGAVTPTDVMTPGAGVAKTDGVTATDTAASASAHGDGHSAPDTSGNSDTSSGNSPADTFRHQRQDSLHNTAEDSEAHRHANSHISNHISNQASNHPGTLGEHATVDGGLAPSLPDAASELWAMSQHSEAPTLSERSWTGGVRGAVLDALRGLAGGRDHVLVNLKRLATHTGISYGSVRNAMSRLTRSGDIRTRQIRMADGHGVRVEFLTLPGQEGTGVAAPGMVSSQAAVLGQASALAQGMTQALAQGMTHAAGQTQGMTHATQPYGHEPYHHPQGGAFAAYGAQHTQGDAPAAYAGASHASPTQGTAQQTVAYTAQGTAQHTAPHAAQPSAYGAVTMTAENYAEGMTDYHTQGFTPVTGGEYGVPLTQQPLTQQPLAQHAPTHHVMTAGIPHMTTAAQGMTPMQQSMTPAQMPLAPTSAPATFWDTADSLFALAWPHVAAAGLHMEHLRALAPIFTVQGFDPAVLPRTLRYLDWELEQQGMPEDMDAAGVPAAPAAVMDAARQLTQSYLRTMQRRGTWPRPLGYEEGDD